MELTKPALELEQKQLQERGNLACQLANEVGNPMTAMYGAIDLLHQFWRDQSENVSNLLSSEQDINNCFQILFDQTQRVDNLLQQLRLFSTITTSNENLTDINDLIQAVAALARVEFSQHTIKITLDLDKEIPAIILDRSELVFCIYHSLNGVLEVSTAGSEIQILTQYEESGAINIRVECCYEHSEYGDHCDHNDETGKELGRLVAENNTLDILEQYAESIRDIITSNAGHLLAYSVPDKHCGITMVFPAIQD